MVLRAFPPFPGFPPTPTFPSSSRPSTGIRFSRWNNANAEPFLRRQRQQKEIEDDIRRHRRYETSTRLADIPDDASVTDDPSTEFKSHGTPSSPSAPSIPGRKSKYSKPPVSLRKKRNPQSSDLSHPAFRHLKRTPRSPLQDEESAINVGETGISYKFEDAPFEFQYSYTETPKVKPLAFREPPYLPFGPSTMSRPWTGRAPLPSSKKKIPEFDSFRPPPPGKKGVKPVQNPGPFLVGSGPKYHAATREEILGDPLTEEEVKDMIKGCMKTTRQLNMGRDGLTHNMLDNIHAHWKRRRVCKIKCKGVCTVDMDNVRQQLEEKTGGKVIYNRGGVIFLFRGRNYNYRTRPRFPLMLWKPTSPVYPRLVQRVLEGLTPEEASEMRKRGRELPPICKLGKNGVYINLVKDVTEAFEECELVRINCKGLNKSDCRKIGAKLKDLVPCVLLSFEFEHILMWRGKDWKSSFTKQEEEFIKDVESSSSSAEVTSINSADPGLVNHQEPLELCALMNFNEDPLVEMSRKSTLLSEEETEEESNDETKHQLPNVLGESESSYLDESMTSLIHGSHQDMTDFVADKSLGDVYHHEVPTESISIINEDGTEASPCSEIDGQVFEVLVAGPTGMDGDQSTTMVNKQTTSELETESIAENSHCQNGMPQRSSLDGVMLLLKQAIDNRSAVILDKNSLDANIVYERAVDLAKTAPPGPIFNRQIRKVTKKKVSKMKGEEQVHQNSEMEVVTVAAKECGQKKSSKKQRKDIFKERFPDVVPHGSLKVDELAKLLA